MTSPHVPNDYLTIGLQRFQPTRLNVLVVFVVCAAPHRSGPEDLAEMAAAAEAWPVPMASVHGTPRAPPSASPSNCPSLHQRERGARMKNRKARPGSVRDEDGQSPHLLGSAGPRARAPG